MLKTVHQAHLKRSDLFDTESWKPLFVKPCSMTPSTLRVTSDEWYGLCGGMEELGIYLHSRFTMVSGMSTCPTRLVTVRGFYVGSGGEETEQDTDLSISIACPLGRPSAVVFGPYDRGRDRALGKATDYLVQQKILILVNMPEGKSAGEWMMQERLRIRDEWERRNQESREAARQARFEHGERGIR